MKPTRRGTLKALAALTLTPVASQTVSAAGERTPSATEGPYYPRPSMRFDDDDNDLVKIVGVVEQAGGEIILLKGRVLDRAGNPVDGARIEIWQCDVNKKYLHTGDHTNRQRDPAFQGFGHDITGPDGSYKFRTIKPVPYPGRTPHIHVKVFHGGNELTTQFYLDGYPGNKRDGLYRRMTRAQRKAVAMVFEQGEKYPETTVDVHL